MPHREKLIVVVQHNHFWQGKYFEITFLKSIFLTSEYQEDYSGYRGDEGGNGGSGEYFHKNAPDHLECRIRPVQSLNKNVEPAFSDHEDNDGQKRGNEEFWVGIH